MLEHFKQRSSSKPKKRTTFITLVTLTLALAYLTSPLASKKTTIKEVITPQYTKIIDLYDYFSGDNLTFIIS